jgi:hypothetical protein
VFEAKGGEIRSREKRSERIDLHADQLGMREHSCGAEEEPSGTSSRVDDAAR